MRIVLATAAIIVLMAETAAAQSAAVDIAFNPGTGPNDIVTSIAVQTNGQILIGGSFTSVNSQSRTRVARLNSDGGLDNDFTPLQGPDGIVLAVEPDVGGKVLIGGSFGTFNSIPRNGFARLRADGSLDLSLTNVLFNSGVTSIKRLADGSYLTRGVFTTVNNVQRWFVARILSTGALDGTFNPTAKLDLGPQALSDVLILPDGKVLIAGAFTSVDGTNRPCIARVAANGALDLTFDAGAIGGGNLYTSVDKILLQPDGRLIVVGDFKSIDGYSRKGLARLQTNGAIDTTFVFPDGIGYGSRAALLQPDGRPVVVGSFSYPFGQGLRNYFARVGTNGVLDASYFPVLGGSAPSSGGMFYSLAMQPDGKLLVGGAFTSINGTNINHLVRLNAEASPSANVELLNPNRYFGAYVSGTLSNTYRVEWTTNLATASLWTPLFNTTLVTNPQFILDPSPISGRQRYYRAISLP